MKHPNPTEALAPALRECFGFHWDPVLGVCFLHEQHLARPISAGRGLENQPSPFVIQTMPRGILCPHQFAEPIHEDASEHPMIVAMGPQQRRGLFYVDPEHQDWLAEMASMIPAPQGLIVPYWGAGFHEIRNISFRLLVTNAAPLVLTYERVVNYADIQTISRMRRLRNLIVSGPYRPAGAVDLSPKGMPLITDWRREGRRQLSAATQRIQS